MRGRLAVAAILVGSATTGGAQVAPPRVGYAVDAWTTADGLPQSDIGSLARDREGYLWLATATGVARFDGDSFVDYPRDGRAPVPYLAKGLTADAEGRAWVLRPYTSLSRVLADGRVEDRITASMPDDPRLLQLGQGESAWLASDRRLFRLQGQEWVPVKAIDDRGVGYVRTLRLDSHGYLWLGGSHGLARIEPRVAGLARRISVLRCHEVFDVAPMPDGTLLVSTCAGLELLRMDARSTDLLLGTPGKAPATVLWRVADTVWRAGTFGVERLELVRRAGGGLQARVTFADPLDLRGASPNGMVGDGGGGVWIGTGGAGLRRVRPLIGRRLTVADGLPSRPVHHLAPDGADGLWVGNCQGLAHWRDGRVTLADTAALGLQSSCVHGLLLDRRGGLWIGRAGALERLEPGARARVMYRLPGGRREELMPVLEDRHGRVWFAGSSGHLGYFPSPHAAPVVMPSGLLPSDRVWSAAEEPDGSVWIGQVGLLTRITGDRVTQRVGVPDGVPPAPIRDLLREADGSLWMATYGGGLVRYRRGEPVVRVRMPGGRFDRLLSALGRDETGRLWLHGDGGLMLVPPDALSEALASGAPLRGTVTISARDGVPEGNGGYRNTWLDRGAQRVWLATVDGVAAVDLSQHALVADRMHVRLDEVRVDGVPVAFGDTVRVPAGADALEFWFSAPPLGAGGTKLLRHRLGGYDKDWVDAGRGPLARYVGVPPGRYVFEALAERAGGGPPPARHAVTVVVLPAWWETPLARAAQVLLVIGALWGAFTLGARRMRARHRVLQGLMAERERAERQAADAARELAHVSRLATAGELATSIAHELNQPLAAVMGSAQKAQRLIEAGGADLRPTLELIVDQSERAADVIRSLRAFVHKQESWDEVDLAAMVEGTLRLLAHELSGRRVTVAVRDERAAPAPAHGSEVQLQQVLVNLLLNAADAMASLPEGQRRAEVVLADAAPDEVRITVTDSGSGIPAAELESIFLPFHTTKSTGLGLGLSLSRSIVEAHAGRLWAENDPAGGARLHMVLPVVHP